MQTNDDLKAIWNQNKIPVILRRTGKGEKTRIRLPQNKINYYWLKNNRRTEPRWDHEGNFWEVPKSWFNDLVIRALSNYGRLYVVQPYREQEKCSPSCMNAMGHECNCSCMGANHGNQNDGSWFEVTDAFATRWGEKHLACRLMIKR